MTVQNVIESHRRSYSRYLAWGLLLLFIGWVGWGILFPPEPLVQWRNDLEQARSEAANAGKPLLIYFTASWCGPCQQMKRTVWADSQVADAVHAGYLPVLVDVDQNPKTAMEYRVQSIPHLVIERPDGDIVDVSTGGMDVQTLLRWINRS